MTVALVGCHVLWGNHDLLYDWTHGNVRGDGIEEIILQGSLREADARPSFRKSPQKASIGAENRCRTTLIPGVRTYQDGAPME